MVPIWYYVRHLDWERSLTIVCGDIVAFVVCWAGLKDTTYCGNSQHIADFFFCLPCVGSVTFYRSVKVLKTVNNNKKHFYLSDKAMAMVGNDKPFL